MRVNMGNSPEAKQPRIDLKTITGLFSYALAAQFGAERAEDAAQAALRSAERMARKAERTALQAQESLEEAFDVLRDALQDAHARRNIDAIPRIFQDYIDVVMSAQLACIPPEHPDYDAISADIAATRERLFANYERLFPENAATCMTIMQDPLPPINIQSGKLTPPTIATTSAQNPTNPGITTMHIDPYDNRTYIINLCSVVVIATQEN